jgi:hypothetical protein
MVFAGTFASSIDPSTKTHIYGALLFLADPLPILVRWARQEPDSDNDGSPIWLAATMFVLVILAVWVVHSLVSPSQLR